MLLNDFERRSQFVLPQGAACSRHLYLWFQPNFSIIMVVRHAFARMYAGPCFVECIVAVKLENQTAFLKHLWAHGLSTTPF